MFAELPEISPQTGTGFCDTRTLPRFPMVSFVYNIIEVICISQKSSLDLIAIAERYHTHRRWSVSTRFPPSSRFTKDGLRASLKLYHGFKQVIFVQ